VHRSHSSFPELSPLILAFNTSTAVWRFNSAYYQHSMLARAQSIQDSSSRKYHFASQHASQLIQTFELLHSTGI
jgi:hypothetical protein